MEPDPRDERTPYQVELDSIEARVFGVLIEKSFSTPDSYPLSLNALTAGCNQKTNREPVMDLAEEEVAAAVHRLIGKHLARRVLPEHGRVDKYAHRGQGMLVVDDAELATLAELLLRGPQTLGELRGRVSRMCPVADLAHMTAILEKLDRKGYVRILPPAPGSRARRYAQTLVPSPSGGGEPTAAPASLSDRVAALEVEVRSLRELLGRVCDRLGVRDAAEVDRDRDEEDQPGN